MERLEMQTMNNLLLGVIVGVAIFAILPNPSDGMATAMLIVVAVAGYAFGVVDGIWHN